MGFGGGEMDQNAGDRAPLVRLSITLISDPPQTVVNRQPRWPSQSKATSNHHRNHRESIPASKDHHHNPCQPRQHPSPSAHNHSLDSHPLLVIKKTPQHSVGDGIAQRYVTISHPLRSRFFLSRRRASSPSSPGFTCCFPPPFTPVCLETRQLPSFRHLSLSPQPHPLPIPHMHPR